jgi:hypothetical protein
MTPTIVEEALDFLAKYRGVAQTVQEAKKHRLDPEFINRLKRLEHCGTTGLVEALDNWIAEHDT